MNKRKRLEVIEVVLDALISLLIEREVITREDLQAKILEVPEKSVFTKFLEEEGNDS